MGVIFDLCILRVLFLLRVFALYDDCGNCTHRFGTINDMSGMQSEKVIEGDHWLARIAFQVQGV
jgi:hypothetical protein